LITLVSGMPFWVLSPLSEVAERFANPRVICVKALRSFWGGVFVWGILAFGVTTDLKFHLFEFGHPRLAGIGDGVLRDFFQGVKELLHDRFSKRGEGSAPMGKLDSLNGDGGADCRHELLRFHELVARLIPRAPIRRAHIGDRVALGGGAPTEVTSREPRNPIARTPTDRISALVLAGLGAGSVVWGQAQRKPKALPDITAVTGTA
jgi:hypothetical protein